MSTFLRPYVAEMSRHTDAPEIFHHACALGLFGSLLSRQSHRCLIDEGVSGRWTNMWILLVGDSGHDRKTTAIGFSEQILNLIDPTLRGPDDMSPEGLLSFFKTRDLTEQNASAVFYQDEFVNLLIQMKRQYSAGLRPMMLKFYDVPSTFKRQLKKEEVKISNPRASIIGGIPSEMLAQYGQPEDWAGGFFNRFIFVQGKKSREQREAPRVSQAIYDKHAMNLGTTLSAWEQNMAGEDNLKLNFTKQAAAIRYDVNFASEEPHLNTMLARAQTHLAKIAAIEQIDEDPESRSIGTGAVERALVFLNHWASTIPMIVSHCRTHGREDFEGDRMPKMILRYLSRCAEPVPESKLLEHCGMNERFLFEALRNLQRTNKVHVVQGNEDQENIYSVK